VHAERTLGFDIRPRRERTPPLTDLQDVIAALIADGDDIDRLVADLSDSAWSLPTPAPGWTIKHQIAHLVATFHLAGLAARDAAAFGALAGRMSNDFDANVHAALNQFLGDPPQTLLAKFRHVRASAADALSQVPADTVVPWLVRPLPPAVLASAGMMELFGHGQDIADALGVRRPHTDRLAYLVAFAVRTWDFGYLARNLTPPETEFRFEVLSPSGRLWTFGPDDAQQWVNGPAVDFCLLVTRRRHYLDLDVIASGPDAEYWLEIAQAYRGPAGDGRAPTELAA
jgi:enediyne biosynthesis protein E11